HEYAQIDVAVDLSVGSCEVAVRKQISATLADDESDDGIRIDVAPLTFPVAWMTGALIDAHVVSRRRPGHRWILVERIAPPIPDHVLVVVSSANLAHGIPKVSPAGSRSGALKIGTKRSDLNQPPLVDLINNPDRQSASHYYDEQNGESD